VVIIVTVSSNNPLNPDGNEYSGLHFSMHETEMSENTKDALLSIFGFYSANSEFYPDEHSKQGWGASVDSKNYYAVDKHGYRNSVDVGRADIIAAGCSQTYGVGVPEEIRWSNQLGKSMNMSQATVSLPGWSTQSIVNGVMSYIKQYGKPKVVALLLPDFYRYDLLVNKDSMVFRLENPKLPDSGPIRRINDVTAPHVELPKVSKRPHVSYEILSAEISYFLSGQFLRFFIEYCKEAKITLVWATLNYPVHLLIDQAKNVEMENKLFQPNVDFDSYVELDYFSGQGEADLLKMTCHKDIKLTQGEFFNFGVDKIGDHRPHMGGHMHAHVAENFKQKLDTLL